VARYEDILKVEFTTTRWEIENYFLSLGGRIKEEEII
jgi:hypothetical protein